MLSTALKNKIRSNFASNAGQFLELEAKFGNFDRGRFNSGLNRQTYNRVKAYFDKMATSKVAKTTDYIMGRVRKSVSENGDVEWITKERLWNEELYDYNIRYSMSREIKIPPVTSHFEPEIIREKFRSSYLVFNNTVRIDITLVTTQQNNKQNITNEVEIELLDPKALDNFEKAIGVTLRLVLDTVILYTEKDRGDVSTEINSILKSNKRGYIDHYPLVQARNLKMRDLVFGGLVGNPKTGYSITHKADGVRKMLYFNRSGIWLASTTSITRLSSAEVPALTGTILDGELIPLEKRLNDAPKNKFWFLVFDTMAWINDNSVQNLHHHQRMQYAQTVVDILLPLKLDLLVVQTKSFFNFDTPAEFFERVREMFRQQPLLPYKEDGFMFTPQNEIYNPHSDKMPLYKRHLTAHPDICKWKPPNELTIDLLLSEGYLYTIEKGGYVPFDKFENVDLENPLTLNLPDSTIVEYAFDYQKNMLVPTRVRFDKDKPNRKDVAEDVAEDIRNPIDKETIQGNTFALLRKYHNSIKKNLFSSVKDERTLLDIGSGYGGDLGKWKHFDKIVAVEPDQEHVEELKKRIKTYNMENKVKIVVAGGQETDKITRAVKEWIGREVDVVSSMLSLTFFWQSSELVDDLTETISRNLRKGGKYLFLTMDGDLVEQTFEPAFGTGQVLKRLDLGPATLEYNSDVFPKELNINIKGTIVENQREWLVRLDDLKLRLEKKGIFQQIVRKADEEKFLTEAEVIMTRMYSYSSFLKVEEVFVESPLMQLPPTPDGYPYSMYDSKLPEVSDTAAPLPPLTKLPTISETVVPLPSISIPLTKLPAISKLPAFSSLPVLNIPSSVDEEDEEELGMLEPDKLEFVNVSWWDEPVVRCGSIGDGSCSIHSILNAYLKIYQINPDRTFRKKFAKELRKGIAEALVLPDPKNPGKIWYETAAKGSFLELHEQQLLGVDFSDIFKQKVDFSIAGLQKLFNSNNFLGDELYSFVAELLDIDLYVMRITNEDLYPHLNTHQEGFNKRSVCICGNNLHFETIGVLREGLVHTFFESGDPFILKIRSFSS